MPLKRSLPAIVILFTNALGATLVIPILPLLAIDVFGATVLQAVLLESSYYAAKLVAAPYLGGLSDRIGRRPVLLVSQAGTFAAFLLFLAALPFERQVAVMFPELGISAGMIVLYIARTFDGLTGGNTTVAKAYITDVTAVEDHAQAFGWLSATLGIGFVIGPAVGGLLAAYWGLRAPFAAGAFVSAIALALAWFLLSESRPQAADKPQKNPRFILAGLRTAAQNPAFGKILIIGFLSTLCFAALSPIFVLYVDAVYFADGVDATEVSRFVGFLYTAVGLTLATTQIGFIKPLVKRLGEKSLIQISQVGMIACFVLIPNAQSRFVFLFLLLPFVIFYGLLEPNLQALLSQTGGPDQQGELFGMYQSTMSVSDLLGPLWAGLVFQHIMPQAVWWTAALILVPATWVAIRLGNKDDTLPLSSHEKWVKEP